jgi:hypothetical protein
MAFSNSTRSILPSRSISAVLDEVKVSLPVTTFTPFTRHNFETPSVKRATIPSFHSITCSRSTESASTLMPISPAPFTVW